MVEPQLDGRSWAGRKTIDALRRTAPGTMETTASRPPARATPPTRDHDAAENAAPARRGRPRTAAKVRCNMRGRGTVKLRQTASATSGSLTWRCPADLGGKPPGRLPFHRAARRSHQPGERGVVL